jgi:hypothetical protein
VEKIVVDDGDGGQLTYYKIGHKEIRQKSLQLVHGQNYVLHYAYVSGKILYVEEVKQQHILLTINTLRIFFVKTKNRFIFVVKLKSLDEKTSKVPTFCYTTFVQNSSFCPITKRRNWYKTKSNLWIY